MSPKHHPWMGIMLAGLCLLLLSGFLAGCQVNPDGVTISATPILPSPTLFLTLSVLLPSATPLPATVPPGLPTPRPDLSRLDEPPLPPNPTQLEKGRHLFWLNCMTCHGDRGQGLTDEFRSLYVEDANCWARGCHAGHNGDQGFPIPRVVPAIISSTGELPPFATAQELFDYLRSTHPPQNPGFMPDEDYWALTAYLLDQNGRLPAGAVLGPYK
jgi:mono/diheme cytochrome c family protein